MEKKFKRAYVYSVTPATAEDIEALGIDAEEIWVSPDIVENPDGKAKVMYMSTILQQFATCDLIYFRKGWDKDDVASQLDETVRMLLEPEGVKVVEEGYEDVVIEMTDAELESLKQRASEARMSVNKWVSLKLREALADGTVERIAESLKCTK